jgi:hypothetical protein
VSSGYRDLTRRPVRPFPALEHQLSVGLPVGPIEVEFDAEQHDGVVGDELPADRRCRDERGADDQQPVVGSVGVGDGECVEVCDRRSRWHHDHDCEMLGRTRWRSA